MQNPILSLWLFSMSLCLAVTGCATTQQSEPQVMPSQPATPVTQRQTVATRTSAIPSPQLAAQAVEPTPRYEPVSEVGNQSPYRVADQTYTVLASSSGYVERGEASWYGPNFHGRQTSNQEIFDMHKMTAAHKTLPLPSYVQVTNLNNDRQVIVRVNDRGPFKPGRIIDLSYAAAMKLGFVDDGIAPVEVRTISSQGDEQREPVATARNTYLQLGAFSSQQNALKALRQLPYEGTHVSTAERAGKVLHILRIGPLADAAEAMVLKTKVSAQGFTDTRIVFE